MEGLMRIGLYFYGSQIMSSTIQRMHKAFPLESPTWIKDRVKENFLHASWFAAEFLKDISPFQYKNYQTHVITNPQLLQEAITQNKIIICLLSHSYNFERILLDSSLLVNCKLCCVYNKVRQFPIVDKAIIEKRKRMSHNLDFLPSDKPISLVKYVLSHVNNTSEPLVMGILGDIRGDEYSNSTSFLGTDRGMIVGAEKIGLMVNAKFFYVSIKSIERGKCSYSFIPITSDSNNRNSITRKFYSLLEQDIFQNPCDWLLWNE